MAEVGQLQTILVTDDRDLIADLHPYHAAKSLNWDRQRSPRARTATGKRLMEIDENLMRANLSGAEQAL